ncbi:MAG: PDZ domain-containing protein [Pirellulales bacterium]|nr:PDZ domain-containing protein [Pirellulales bacterium]
MTPTPNHVRKAMTILLLLASGVAMAEDDLGLFEQRAFQSAAARVGPSVVRIETIGGRERLGETGLGSGPTTGLVVGADGLIVSSEYGFAGHPDSVLVHLADGTRKPARLLATDHSRMLVLLKIEPDAPLVVPSMAPREANRVGQWAIAVGRTFEADRLNVAVGIVSALGRIGGRAIQTDAAVSPNNYGGPLIDVRGRVLGVLTPLSPEDGEEFGRTEWYDAGIGFAVPAEDVLGVLPRLVRGEDLFVGRLGVGFGRSDPNTAEPVVAACQPGSPAFKVLKPGDRITSVDGKTVDRVVEFGDALARRYAGDTVAIGFRRGAAEHESRVTLVAELPPYERPFLGILPRRGAAAAVGPVAVRFVFPDSAASKAGIAPGDDVLAIDGEPLAGASDLRQRIALFQPGDRVTVDVRRRGATRRYEVRLGRLPEGMPEGELPAARDPAVAEGAGRAPRGKVDIAVPEVDNKAWAYVPEQCGLGVSCGVVVWLDAPGAVADADILKLWKATCDCRDLILLAVHPAQPGAWLPSEESAVARMVHELAGRYAVDENRIVVHGYQGGGTLGLLLAFRHRDLVRAVATVDALPSGEAPAADPVHPLDFFLFTVARSAHALGADRAIQSLREARHPVLGESIGNVPRYLGRAEIERLGGWIDALDRI